MSEAAMAAPAYRASPALDAQDSFDDSLWTRTAAPALPLPVLRESRSVEVAVIGAGYTGLSAAIEMQQRGAQVAVLDAREPGFGASGRNGGQVVPAFKREPQTLIAALGEELGRGLVDMVLRSADAVFDTIERHGIACDAVRSGWIQGAHRAASEDRLRRRCEIWGRAGADVRWLEADELLRLSGSRWFRTGWMLARAGSVHPLKYARGLALAAQRLGALLFRDSPATGLQRVGDQWRVSTPEGELRARRVVLATNGHTSALWPGLRESIVPLYSMQVATEPLPPHIGAAILPQGQTMTDARQLVNYFRCDAHGRFIIGSRGPFTANPSAADARSLIAMARCLYPQLRDVDFPYRWAGRVAMTADALPHLHRLAPGLTAALGYNGRGVAMATAMGRVLAAASLDDRADAWYPTTPLRPIPFHRLHRAGVQLMLLYYRAADRFA